MDSDLKRRRIITIAAIAVVAGVLAFFAYGNIGGNLVYYWSPKECTPPATRRWAPPSGSAGWSSRLDRARGDRPRPAASRSPTATPPCRCTPSTVPPAMFREGIGVVVEGTMSKAGVFECRRLMVKHDNEYRAPGAGDKRDIRELMKSPRPRSGRRVHTRMISSLGQGLVLLALLLCAIGSPIGYVAGRTRSRGAASVDASPRARLHAGDARREPLMEVALLRHDFSVSYVAHVGRACDAGDHHRGVAVVVARRLDPVLGLVLGIYLAAVACSSAAATRTTWPTPSPP
jgi:cytochrome c-type biogenesis protein CcmE